MVGILNKSSKDFVSLNQPPYPQHLAASPQASVDRGSVPGYVVGKSTCFSLGNVVVPKGFRFLPFYKKGNICHLLYSCFLCVIELLLVFIC